MLSVTRAFTVLLVLAFAFIMASSEKSIPHSYILSLNEDVAASVRDSIVASLKTQGAKVSAMRSITQVRQQVCNH